MDVLESLKHQQGRSGRKKSIRLLEKFNACMQWLHNISGVIDIACQINPVMACPAWAPIKFILIVSRHERDFEDHTKLCQISKGHSDAIELIVRVFQSVSESCIRFQLYGSLASHHIMRNTLLEFYTGVLDFAALAYKYFTKRAMSESNCFPLLKGSRF
jgi:hypothetical protein